MTRYRVLTGLSWPGRRAELGETIDDLLPASIPWLLAQGAIEPVERAPEPAFAPAEPALATEESGNGI